MNNKYLKVQTQKAWVIKLKVLNKKLIIVMEWKEAKQACQIHYKRMNVSLDK